MVEVRAIEIVAEGLHFPEGAFWSAQDGCLYFVEWAGDTVRVLRDNRCEVLFQTQAGDGPCGVSQDQQGNLWVCLYSSRKLVRMTPSGQIMDVIDSYAGQPFKGPNDLVTDRAGGLYFTDSGDFEDDWVTGRPAGAIYYFDPAAGELHQVDGGLCFPNGIALSPDGKTLIVGEHRRNRLLAYTVEEEGRLTSKRVLCELGGTCLLPDELHYELGPDGMCCDTQGRLWVAHYGSGKVVILNLEGDLLGSIALLKGRKPTNTAISSDGRVLYITEGELGLLYRTEIGVEAQR